MPSDVWSESELVEVNWEKLWAKGGGIILDKEELDVNLLHVLRSRDLFIPAKVVVSSRMEKCIFFTFLQKVSIES